MMGPWCKAPKAMHVSSTKVAFWVLPVFLRMRWALSRAFSSCTSKIGVRTRGSQVRTSHGGKGRSQGRSARERSTRVPNGRAASRYRPPENPSLG